MTCLVVVGQEREVGERERGGSLGRVTVGIYDREASVEGGKADGRKGGRKVGGKEGGKGKLDANQFKAGSIYLYCHGGG